MERGQHVLISGRSGCGKTSLLKSILALFAESRCPPPLLPPPAVDDLETAQAVDDLESQVFTPRSEAQCIASRSFASRGVGVFAAPNTKLLMLSDRPYMFRSTLRDLLLLGLDREPGWTPELEKRLLAFALLSLVRVGLVELAGGGGGRPGSGLGGQHATGAGARHATGGGPPVATERTAEGTESRRRERLATELEPEGAGRERLATELAGGEDAERLATELAGIAVAWRYTDKQTPGRATATGGSFPRCLCFSFWRSGRRRERAESSTRPSPGSCLNRCCSRSRWLRSASDEQVLCDEAVSPSSAVGEAPPLSWTVDEAPPPLSGGAAAVVGTSSSTGTRRDDPPSSGPTVVGTTSPSPGSRPKIQEQSRGEGLRQTHEQQREAGSNDVRMLSLIDDILTSFDARSQLLVRSLFEINTTASRRAEEECHTAPSDESIAIDWAHTTSQGEKQRLAAVRVMVHAFAFLVRGKEVGRFLWEGRRWGSRGSNALSRGPHDVGTLSRVGRSRSWKVVREQPSSTVYSGGVSSYTAEFFASTRQRHGCEIAKNFLSRCCIVVWSSGQRCCPRDNGITCNIVVSGTALVSLVEYSPRVTVSRAHIPTTASQQCHNVVWHCGIVGAQLSPVGSRVTLA